MSFVLRLAGYDLSDEGPGRTVNEDATLVREDLGLFALADGAGGRGRGDVAAKLALRSIENYVGSTVRRSHDRPDRDVLGIFEQAKRISSAVHQAHRNIIEIAQADPLRKGMATTIVAALIAPRTNQIHIAHVGDSRCYRIRHRRIELMTTDDSIATDILELRPETPEDILGHLPRNSVVRALGMAGELRVRLSSHDLFPGDVFLLCSDGLTSSVALPTIRDVLGEGDPPNVVASELLNHALAAHAQDNISVVVIETTEEAMDDAVETRRYVEVARQKPSTPPIEAPGVAAKSPELAGPDVLADNLLGELGPEVEALENWRFDSEFPTVPLSNQDLEAAQLAMIHPEPASSPELAAVPFTNPPSAKIDPESLYVVEEADFEMFEDEQETS
jgi:serine/threonine protein phosphatase PrpC